MQLSVTMYCMRAGRWKYISPFFFGAGSVRRLVLYSSCGVVNEG
jgi:hypothetical protein